MRAFEEVEGGGGCGGGGAYEGSDGGGLLEVCVEGGPVGAEVEVWVKGWWWWA